MSITPEVPAKTLTQLVATEIKVQMARADVRQSQLARSIGKTEQWLSVRLRGRQAFDINDLALIAKGLGVGLYDLLPSPEVVGQAVDRSDTVAYLALSGQLSTQTSRPRDNRPAGRSSRPNSTGVGRTAYLSRTARRRPA
jgi:transcriptional regulator with XRE-family HTH domain